MTRMLSNYIEEANPEFKKKVAKKASQYSDSVKNYIKRKRKKMADMSEKAAERTKKAVTNTADRIGTKTGEAIGNKVTQSDDFKRTAKDASKASEKVGKAADITKNVVKGAAGVGAAIVAAKVIKAGRNEYRNKVMGQCAKYTGRDENICRIQAAKYHQRFLNSKLSSCNKSSNPEKCRERIKSAIQRAKKTEDKMVLKLR